MSDTCTLLTTGANSGIGLAAVIELARRGLRSVSTVRSQSSAEKVAAAAAEAGVAAETMLLDGRRRCRRLRTCHRRAATVRAGQ